MLVGFTCQLPFALFLILASTGHSQSNPPHREELRGQPRRRQLSSSWSEKQDPDEASNLLFQRIEGLETFKKTMMLDESQRRDNNQDGHDHWRGNKDDNRLLSDSSTSTPRSQLEDEFLRLLSSHQHKIQHYLPSQPTPPSNRAVRRRKVQEGTTTPQRSNNCVDGIKMIVKCKGGVTEDTCKQELIDNGVNIVSDMKETMYFAICANTPEEIDFVSHLTIVDSIEDDPPRILAHIPGSDRIRNLQADEQVIPYGVDMVKAPQFWEQYGSRGAGIKVCVIDSGLRATHEDLEGADLSGTNDEAYFLPWNDTGYNHGTHVTGTIAARDNSVGVVGVAPEASVHIVRLLSDEGTYTVSHLIEAMRACNEAGVDIINMSLVGVTPSSAEREYVRQLRESGVLLVASSGNFGGLGYNFLYPAAYDDVVSVGAVDDKRRIASFSDYNSKLDVVAPGVNVLSMGIKSDHSYIEKDGTSMAAPHVSGVAALLWSQFPKVGVDEILTALTESARDLGACGYDRHYGYGMVDAIAAAAYLEGNMTVTSPDIGNCVEVEINVTTDAWGEETLYFVTPRGRNNNILYREGPYPPGEVATYTSAILLPDACYDFMLFDTEGDGANCLSQGVFTVTYDGVEQVNYDDFTGSKEIFTFGNCD